MNDQSEFPHGVRVKKVFRRLKEADVVRALAANHGLLVQSAMALGVSREALCQFVKRRPHLQDYRDAQVEIVLDVAENNVVTGIYNGDDKYTRWYLDRKGQSRGYVTRQEVSGPGGAPVPFTMIERVPPLKLIDVTPNPE